MASKSSFPSSTASALLLALALSAGCTSLDAWKGVFGFNQRTGQATGELKGAGPGGEFNENKGLNLSVGDNTLPALAIAGLLGVGIVFAYPIQRHLRLRREERVLREQRMRDPHRKRRSR